MKTITLKTSVLSSARTIACRENSNDFDNLHRENEVDEIYGVLGNKVKNINVYESPLSKGKVCCNVDHFISFLLKSISKVNTLYVHLLL